MLANAAATAIFAEITIFSMFTYTAAPAIFAVISFPSMLAFDCLLWRISKNAGLARLNQRHGLLWQQLLKASSLAFSTWRSFQASYSATFRVTDTSHRVAALACGILGARLVRPVTIHSTGLNRSRRFAVVLWARAALPSRQQRSRLILASVMVAVHAKQRSLIKQTKKEFSNIVALRGQSRQTD